MEIVIDLAASVPVLDQLVGQIKQAVLRDNMFPGDALPSITQLAGDLELDSRTVLEAYRLLERDSVVRIDGYRGASIHPSWLVRILQDRADHGWPPALLHWMQGAGRSTGGPNLEAAQNAESWK